MKAALALLLTLAFVMAGCAGAADPASVGGSATTTAPGVPDGPAPTATVTDETGSIAITITTPELQPVPGAQVVLEGHDLTAFTDEAGAATFNDLAPGKYTVLAAKAGFKSSSEKGRLVDVLPGEITEVKLLMEPIQIVTAETSYHKTTIVTGFMACAFWISVVGYNNNCGRGVYTTSGSQIANPNDKTIHAWQVENDQVQSMILELKWTPAQATLGQELWGRIMATWVCDGPGGQTCGPYNQIEGKGGVSPLMVRKDEGANGNLTKKIGTYAKAYPYDTYIEVRPWCHTVTSNPPGNCYFNIMINQRYEGFATVHYGEAAPQGFTVLPK